MTRLYDLGEREIIRQIVSRYCSVDIGDDCAAIAREHETIIVTTDPVPPPAAEVIGGDDDPYWKGWLLTIINASDLAAAAAEPLAFFVSAEAPSDLLVSKFERFFNGVSDACRQEGLVYAGGNIREGAKLAAVGTAIGVRSRENQLGRRGIDDGDVMAIIGNGGQFWLDALRCTHGDTIDKNSSPLFSPCSQSRSMRVLANAGVLAAAMDNSDGLLPTLQQMANENEIGVVLELDALHPPPGYNEAKHFINISHERLWLGWGDWNIVVAIKSKNKSIVEDVCRQHAIPISICGYFSKSISGVQIKCHDDVSIAPRLDSERFAKDSWFSEGIEGYINRLRNVSLPGGV